MSERRVVCLVDDDESVRESLPGLLHELGFDARAFSSAKAFLASKSEAECECLILDIAMPEMSGPELQRDLRRRGREIPIVFVTAQVDPRVERQVLAQGAVACLFKPFSQTDLLEALGAAFRTA
jgi:FixJ family two-component response regulator